MEMKQQSFVFLFSIETKKQSNFYYYLLFLKIGCIKKLTINFVAENDGELSAEEDFAEVKVEHQVIFAHRALFVFFSPFVLHFRVTLNYQEHIRFSMESV